MFRCRSMSFCMVVYLKIHSLSWDDDGAGKVFTFFFSSEWFTLIDNRNRYEQYSFTNFVLISKYVEKIRIYYQRNSKKRENQFKTTNTTKHYYTRTVLFMFSNTLFPHINQRSHISCHRYSLQLSSGLFIKCFKNTYIALYSAGICKCVFAGARHTLDVKLLLRAVFRAFMLFWFYGYSVHFSAPQTEIRYL